MKGRRSPNRGPLYTEADVRRLLLWAAGQPEAARSVWVAWKWGMLAQDRHVAPERLRWSTLWPEDHRLDAAIAARVASDLLELAFGHPERLASEVRDEG